MNDLGTCLYGYFEGFDCLNVMTRLGDGAMTRGAERCRRDAERGVESSNNLRSVDTASTFESAGLRIHNSKKILDLTWAGRLPP
jgi:hypothetical protein